MKIHHFCFNPFQENTYILYDDSKECIIIDPGCYDSREQQLLTGFITKEGLKPVCLLNTHCHIDHVFGNKFVADTYALPLEIHAKDKPVLDSLLQVAKLYNLNAEASPEPAVYLEEGNKVKFGNTELQIVFTPGHSPGSICFIAHADKAVIGGDVLFRESIGRSDLPGGNHAVLLDSIRTKLFQLPDDYGVYSGHGEPTTIGHEKKHNPFLQ